jgi:hypothetical protein
LCVFCADFHFPLYGKKIEMDFALRFVSSALSDINYETMNSGNTQTAMTLAANPIVEKCLTKMANDVTAQVRDKLVEIIIAVIAREYDVDDETVRRLIYAELESTPMTFALEKHAAVSKTKTPKTTKTKVVELDADGNTVKKVRTPKEPKEKAPKAAKEPKAPKAPKVELTEEEKAEKQAEKEAAKAAAKEARKLAKIAAKDADKEAAKEAARAEKEAAKEAAKAEKAATKEAAKEAAKAEKEAAKLAKPAKEQRIPIPWCGVRIPDRCEALRSYHGLFAQCVSDSTETSIFCPSCEKTGAQFGTVTMRSACGVFDYTDPKGKKCVRLANVVEKFGFTTCQAFQEEAAKHGITIPYEHLEKEVKQRGRPKSSSPRARPATKIATSDTGSGSETETDDEEYQAKKQEKQQQQQQQRKKVTKTAAAADSDAAPKKRGRPAKAKEAAPEPTDDLIQELVASAKKAATPKAVTPAAVAKSAPTSPELSEDEVSSAPVVVIAKPAAAKLSAKPKVAKPKAPEREEVECDGEKFWRQIFNGEEILVRCSDNLVFCSRDGVGYNIGTWDEKTRTVIEDEEESSDEE